MATINEIANAATYTGNAALGGRIDSTIDIDIKPLQDLAKYTIVYNQAEYTQRQKDAEKRAAELADIASFDFSTIDPKWRGEISDKMNELTSFVRENPNVFNYQQNPDGYLQYQQKKQEVNKAVKAGKTNQLLLTARKESIANAPDVNMKGILQKELDSDLAKTGLFDFLPVEEKYDLTFSNLADAKKVSFDVIQQLPNSDVIRNFKLTDMGYVNSQANLVSFDDIFKPLDETSQAFIGATPEEQSRLRSQEERNKLLRKSGWMKMGNIAQQIFSNPAYKKEDGSVDWAKIAADPNAAPLGELVLSVNAKIETERENIKNGIYKDKNGKTVLFDGKFLKETDYTPINVNDGLSGAEIAKLTMIASAAPDTEDTKIQQTNSDTERRKLGIDWYNAVTRRIDANRPTTKSAAKQPTIIQDPAILFGKHVQRLQDYFSKNNGQAFKVPFSKLDDDTRAALGFTPLDDNAIKELDDKDRNQLNKKQIVVYKPDGTFEIQDDNGTVIRVGTLDGLKKGFIDAVKAGGKLDATQTEGFQVKAEDGFNAIFGTNDANAIFKGLMNKSNSVPTENTPSTNNSRNPIKISAAEKARLISKYGL